MRNEFIILCALYISSITFICNAHTIMARAELLNHAGKFTEALHCYTQAVIDDPNNAMLFFAIGRTHWLLEQYNDALSSFNKALTLDPHYTQARMWRARLLLMHGYFKQGWREHESFITKTHNANHTPITPADNLQGQTWLLESIGGFGDIFQFIRYAQLLHNRGVRIILRTPHALKPLLSLIPYIDACITADDPIPAHDRYCALTSLPFICNTLQESDIPNAIPYLYADATLRTAWQQAIDPTSFTIGICWHACHLNDKIQRFPAEYRNIPLELLTPLAQLPHVKLYSLQRIDGLSELSNTRNITSFDSLDTHHGAFMDTAALLSHLNLIITVDTAIAHLAGALGAPTLLLLPYHADWRWFVQRTDSPWYPSVTIIRQKKVGDWQSVADEIHKQVLNISTQKCPC